MCDSWGVLCVIPGGLLCVIQAGTECAPLGRTAGLPPVSTTWVGNTSMSLKLCHCVLRSHFGSSALRCPMVPHTRRRRSAISDPDVFTTTVEYNRTKMKINIPRVMPWQDFATELCRKLQTEYSKVNCKVFTYDHGDGDGPPAFMFDISPTDTVDYMGLEFGDRVVMSDVQVEVPLVYKLEPLEPEPPASTAKPGCMIYREGGKETWTPTQGGSSSSSAIPQPPRSQPGIVTITASIFAPPPRRSQGQELAVSSGGCSWTSVPDAAGPSPAPAAAAQTKRPLNTPSPDRVPKRKLMMPPLPLNPPEPKARPTSKSSAWLGSYLPPPPFPPPHPYLPPPPPFPPPPPPPPPPPKDWSAFT